MEEKKVQNPIMLYTEQTPNPESLKFVTNRMLYKGIADFRDENLAKEWSPLATFLFELPYVRQVYISNNFVTVAKEMNYSWAEIMIPLKEKIKEFINNEGGIVNDGFKDAMDKINAETDTGYQYSGDEKEIVQKIKDLLDQYVRPAVEADGGNIAFHSWNDGVVTVILQGSCSGCPSSTITLKSGIEAMLQRMIPEVKEVRAEAEGYCET